MSVDGVSPPAPRSVRRRRDAEPDRVRRHLSRCPKRSSTASSPSSTSAIPSAADEAAMLRLAPPRRRARDPRRRATRSPSPEELVEARTLVDATTVSDASRSTTSSRSCAGRASSRASRSVRARAPRCISSRPPRPRPVSPAASSSSPTTSSPSRPPCCATACSSAPRPSSSATRADDAVRTAIGVGAGPAMTARRRARAIASRGRRGSSRWSFPVPLSRGAARASWSCSIVVRRACRARGAAHVCAARAPRVAARVASRPARRATPTAPTSTGSRSARRNAPDFTIEPAIGTRRARRDGRRRTGAARHQLPPVAARRTGPLGLGRGRSTGDGAARAARVSRRLAAARRLVIALRRGRFRDPGLRTRGPLGLGTDFESIRDYLPDDDVRQINWHATERVGPADEQPVPRSNRTATSSACSMPGRLDGARRSARCTRLDAAVDAVTMVALVADELGDRCGVIVFDDEIRAPSDDPAQRRHAVVRRRSSTSSRDSSTATTTSRSARSAAPSGRSIIVFTDLVDEAAARSLLAAVPVLARRHAVVVASVTIPTSTMRWSREPRDHTDVYGAAVALDVLDARAPGRGARCAAPGRVVLEAPAALLGEACVGAYLRLKARARLESRSAAGAPEPETPPQNTTPRPTPTTSTVARPWPDGVTKPSTRPATTSHAAVPSSISAAARDSSRSASPRGRDPGIDDAPNRCAAPRPRRRDATELQAPVRQDLLEEWRTVAGPDGDARTSRRASARWRAACTARRRRAGSRPRTPGSRRGCCW